MLFLSTTVWRTHSNYIQRYDIHMYIYQLQKENQNHKVFKPVDEGTRPILPFKFQTESGK